MNRSSKGFGLAGVALCVVLLVVSAVMSAPAKSADTITANAHSVAK